LKGRAVDLRIHGDQILDAFVRARSNPGDIDDVFGIEEWSVCFTIINDLLCSGGTDAWQSIQFGDGGGVDIDHLAGGSFNLRDRRANDR